MEIAIIVSKQIWNHISMFNTVKAKLNNSSKQSYI